jgi:hypothetical protein
VRRRLALCALCALLALVGCAGGSAKEQAAREQEFRVREQVRGVQLERQRVGRLLRAAANRRLDAGDVGTARTLFGLLSQIQEGK